MPFIANLPQNVFVSNAQALAAAHPTVQNTVNAVSLAATNSQMEHAAQAASQAASDASKAALAAKAVLFEAIH